MRNYERRMKDRIERLKGQYPDKSEVLENIPRHEVEVISRQSAKYIEIYFLRLLEIEELPADFWD